MNKYLIKYDDIPVGFYYKEDLGEFVHYFVIGRFVEYLEDEGKKINTELCNDYYGKDFKFLDDIIDKREEKDFITIEECDDNYYCFDKHLLRRDTFKSFLDKKDYEGLYDKEVILFWNLASLISEIFKKSPSYRYSDKAFIMKKLLGSNIIDDLGFNKLFEIVIKRDEVVELGNYYEDGDDKILYDDEEKSSEFIERYNIVIHHLKKYYHKVIDLKDKKEEEIIKINENKCIKLFKEMLEAIDEDYDDNWSIVDWLKIMNLRYQYLGSYFDDIKYNLFVNDSRDLVAVSVKLDEVYSDLEEDYKNDIKFYKKYKLKDGETYSDICDKKREEFKKLFIEMLDYVGVDTENKDFDILALDTIDYYPYLTQEILNLTHMEWRSTNKEQIERYDGYYRYFLKTYKNREENIKKYEEEQKLWESLDIDLDDLE